MKTLSIRSYGIFCAARRSWQPLPMSKRNFSPLPSSTSQHAAACFGRTLGMPVRITEQYPKGLGATVPEIAALLEGDEPAQKMRFSCRGCTDLDRPQWIVCGIESHVCVYQTVRDLLADGKQVAVAVDAVSSCDVSDRETALAYMRDLGAQLMSTQMLMFEVLRDAGTPEFKSVAGILKE